MDSHSGQNTTVELMIVTHDSDRNVHSDAFFVDGLTAGLPASTEIQRAQRLH
jgi:hypothetical protein